MKDSKSIFLFLNNTDKQQLDADGIPLNGARVFLDGDLFDTKGNLIMQRPAVDTDGHIEYWREGKLHRDDGLEAVYTDGFTTKEYWENGIRIK